MFNNFATSEVKKKEMCDILSFMFVRKCFDRSGQVVDQFFAWRVSASDSGSDFHRGARRTLYSMDVIDQTIDTTISPQE